MDASLRTKLQRALSALLEDAEAERPLIEVDDIEIIVWF